MPTVSTKEFAKGLMLLAFALGFLVIGAHYKVGSSAEPGPGFFPRALSIALTLIALLIIARSFISEGEPIPPVAWKPALHVIGSTAAFAGLLPRVGLPIALAVLVIGCATASRHFRLELKAVAGLVALIITCALVFVTGLGLPIPIWGRWLSIP